MRKGFISFLLIACALKGGSAFKIEPPDIVDYKDPSGKIELHIPREGNPWLTVIDKKGQMTKHAWKAHMDQPSDVLLSPKNRVVLVLGGLGDPGLKLGLVEIYTFEGKLLKKIELSSMIDDLETMSQQFTEKMGPFQWIAGSELSKDETQAKINVCRKKVVEIDLKSFKVTVSNP